MDFSANGKAKGAAKSALPVATDKGDPVVNLEHPGDELAILTFAGEDATTEFDMILPPDVVEKYAPDAIMGVVGNGKAKKAKGAAKSALLHR